MVIVEKGKRSHRITHEGRGQYLAGKFHSVADAEQHAKTRLADDPEAMYYVLLDGEIAAVILNHEVQRQKRQRRRWRYGIVSTFVLALFSFWISPFFGTGQFVFVVAVVCLYGALLWMFGAANVEATVVMVIAIVLVSLLVPAIRKAQRRKTEISPPHLCASVAKTAAAADSALSPRA